MPSPQPAASRACRPSSHHPQPGRRAAAAVAALALLLAACGGGGGGNGGAVVPDPGTPPTELPSVDTSPVPVADPGSTLPADWSRGPFAQIFVRSYRDSDGDGHGDLRGLIEKLPHLQELGVTGIWLMPITASQDGDHGYAVADYRAIEPRYGTLADLDALLRQAHARGIGVVADYVANHSAATHPAFVNARSGSGNAFRNWYLFQNPKPSGWSIYGQDPWRNGPTGAYFAPFWDQMPDFNLTNPAVLAWHQDNLRFWLNRGVDGFRFDAVGNLVENSPAQWEDQPQNDAILAALRTTIQGYSRRWLVCEGPAAPLRWAQPQTCGSAFAFGLNNQIVAAARGDGAAVARVAEHFRSAPIGMATMVSNHDSFAGQRLYDQVGGNQAQYRMAAATYLLLPGVPFIYYGEEIGMAGASSLSGDPRLRTPMSWTASGGFSSGTPYRAAAANRAAFHAEAQRADPNSLLNWYQALIALRKAQPALRSGGYANAVATQSVLSFERPLGNERVWVALNYGTSSAGVRLAGVPASATLANVFPPSGTDATADGSGALTVVLPAQSVRVFRLP